MGFKEKTGRENWAKDESTAACSCGRVFTITKRRHHCRSCGGVFCDACTNFQALVPTGEGGLQGGTKRVCQPCYNVLKDAQLTARTGTEGADLQYVQVAIKKTRQEATVHRQRYTDRAEVLLDGVQKLLDDIRAVEHRLTGRSLFTGNTHDIMVQDLQDLCAAYERRHQRGKEMHRMLRFHTTTAFFTVVNTRLLEVLLHFVLAASMSETTAKCTISLLQREVHVTCRNLNTHFVRLCGEGVSVRDLCEAMQDIAEEVALELTFHFTEQIVCLTPSGARTFGECILARMLAFLQQDVVPPGKSRVPPSDLLVDSVDDHEKCTSDDAVPLETRDKSRDTDWTDKELVSMVGVKTVDGAHFHLPEAPFPYKYYYCIGTVQKAKSRKLLGTGADRNCIDPVFDPAKAAQKHQLLLESRGNILSTYFLSRLTDPDLSEQDQLVGALDKIADLLRDPSAYGRSLLSAGEAALERVEQVAHEVERMVQHSRDLVDAPEALTQQASYIRLQHELQTAALKDFIALLSDHKVLLLYSQLRLKLLQQLLLHRAYGCEAISAWPDVLVGGTPSRIDEGMLGAVESVLVADRTGCRNPLELLDEASHVIPRWLAERHAPQLPQLAEAGVEVLAECLMARLLCSLPHGAEETASPRGLVGLGTGTLSVVSKERRAQRPPTPLGPHTSMQMPSVMLENTLVGQRHVILPTESDVGNWKESSFLTKCGMVTAAGHKYRGTTRHHKPHKYGYAKTHPSEAASLGLIPVDASSPPLPGVNSSPPRMPSKNSNASFRQASVSPSSPVTNLSMQGGLTAMDFPTSCEVEAKVRELAGMRGRVVGVETEPPNAGRIRVIFPPPVGERILRVDQVVHAVSHEDFPPGTEAVAHSLVGAAELNGVTGRVLMMETDGPNTGRVLVRFPHPHGQRALKPENLRRVDPADDSMTRIGKSAHNISWPHSSLVCTPRIVTAGAQVNCVLVTRDKTGKLADGKISPSELDVVPFAPGGVEVEVEPMSASEDGSTFQFTLTVKQVGTFPIAVACRGKCKVSNNITVVAGPVDFLGRSRILVAPHVATAGEAMHGRVELRDRLGNLATSAGLEDFTVSVTNIVELSTTSLRQSLDGAFEFSFIPTEEGDVEVTVGFGGLLRQFESPLECRSGVVDFKNTLVALTSSEVEVGEHLEGVLVLRDLYGNRAANTRADDVELWLRAGDSENRVVLDVSKEEPSEFNLAFQCTRRGLMLLEAESTRTHERVVTKVAVAMSDGVIDWERSTVSLVPREVQAGHTVTCTILCRDSYGNLVTSLSPDVFRVVICSDPPPAIDPNHGPLIARGGTVAFEFEPLFSGCTWVLVYHKDHEKRSNDVQVAAGPMSWDLSTCEIQDEARVGDAVPVHITSRDRFGNICPLAHKADFQVTVWNEGHRLEHTPVDGVGGQFIFTFEPIATGQAWVEVSYSHRSKESPRCAILPGQLAWEHCRVVLDRTRIKAGEVLRCDIILTDKCGNETSIGSHQGSDFLATVCRADGQPLTNSEANATAVDGVGSRFWFQFSPSLVGDLFARISLCGANRDSQTAEVVPAEIWWERCDVAFEREETMAGMPLLCFVHAKDRFGNPSEVLSYSSGYSPTVVKHTDFKVVAKNQSELDHEVLDLANVPCEEYGTFSLETIPKMMGVITAIAQLTHTRLGDASSRSDVELTATCLVRGGGVDWDSSTVTLNPPELIAGEEAYGCIHMKDRFGNDTAGAKPMDFLVKVLNEGRGVRVSDVVATGEATFAFTAEPTKAGTAFANVELCAQSKESNMVFVRPGPLCFTSSTFDWGSSSVYAGDHLEGTLTFRDRFGNPTHALPPDEVQINVNNEGTRVQAIIIDDYVAAAETTQIRFYCEPTVRGVCRGEAVYSKTGEVVECSGVDVKAGPVDWARSTTELPAGRAGEPTRVIQAGESVTGVVTCRDKYGNLASPGTENAFTLLMKSNGQLVTAPTPYVPGVDKRVQRTDDVCIFHFDARPTIAGLTEIEVRYNPEPREMPHRVQLDVRSGNLDWRNQCSVLLDEREITAGEILHFTIRLKDGFGNTTAGAVGTMFSTMLMNAGTRMPTSAVTGKDDTFTFTAPATTAGDAYAVVEYRGEPQRSPVARVLPGPVHFPKCILTLPDPPAVAGTTFKAVLQLFDRYGNETSLGSLSAMDIHWVLRNVGSPSATDARPQTKLLEPSGPLSPKGMGVGSKACELALPFVPQLKGVVHVECSCSRDEHGHKLTGSVPVGGGRFDPRTSTITLRPTEVQAGQTVHVEVQVKDANGNPTSFESKHMEVVVTNERDSVKPSELEDIPGGFKFSFVPTRQGKAKARIKDKTTKVEVESQLVTVRCGPFHPESSSVKIEPSSQIAGKPVLCTLTLRDQFKNSLSLDGEDHEQLFKQIKLEVKNGYARVEPGPFKTKNANIMCEVAPTERGEAYVELSVPAVTKQVLQSNTVEIRPGPVSFPHSMVLIDTEACPVNQPTSLIVTTKDKFKNVTTGAKVEHFTVTVYNQDEEIAQPKLLGKDKSSTAFSAQFVPTKVGQCYCIVVYQPPGAEPEEKQSNVVQVTT